MAIRQDKSSVGANGSLHISHGESALIPPMDSLPWKAPLAWHVKWTLILITKRKHEKSETRDARPILMKFPVWQMAHSKCNKLMGHDTRI